MVPSVVNKKMVKPLDTTQQKEALLLLQTHQNLSNRDHVGVVVFFFAFARPRLVLTTVCLCGSRPNQRHIAKSVVAARMVVA